MKLGLKLHPVWVLVIAIVASIIGFGALTILGLSSGMPILGLGSLLLGAFVVFFLFEVLVIYGVYLLWLRIPRNMQLLIGIVLLAVSVVLVQPEITIPALVALFMSVAGVGPKHAMRGR